VCVCVCVCCLASQRDSSLTPIRSPHLLEVSCAPRAEGEDKRARVGGKPVDAKSRLAARGQYIAVAQAS